MKEFTENEISFLNSIEEARVASSHDKIVHVKPISFLMIDGKIVFATDYNTRTLNNIKTNPNISIVIDQYNPGNHKAIIVQGISKMIENGKIFQKYYDLFFKKFAWVRKDPWKENEAPFVTIDISNKVSWGIN